MNFSLLWTPLLLLLLLLLLHICDLSCQSAEANVTELGLQVINRAKLERAGKDNVFVKLLYGKDRARAPQTIEEQQRIGRAKPVQ